MPENYKDYWYHSRDGLRLYAREYGSHHHNCIICIPGLTRSSADFARLSSILAAQYRVLAVDLRGRGRSQYDPTPANYQPAVYADDILTLLDSQQLDQVQLIGTSLGGLTSLLLCASSPSRIRSAVINDIGPQLNPAGIARITAYVSAPQIPAKNWQEAVARTREIQQREYPLFNDQDWLDFTRNLYREDQLGRPVLNYDPNIAQPLQTAHPAAPSDLWSVFEAASTTPMLLLRGELSDLLSRDCVGKMQDRKPDLQVLEIADTGHAPLLTEPPAQAAIQAFLKRHSD